jgi:hypothetical protein
MRGSLPFPIGWLEEKLRGWIFVKLGFVDGKKLGGGNVVFIGVFCDFRGETWWKIVVNLWWNAWQTWSADGRFYGDLNWDRAVGFIFGLSQNGTGGDRSKPKQP